VSLPVWKCNVCGKKFSVGEWTCADGQSNHVVEMKEYLLADAPTDPGHPANGGVDSLRDGRTRICNIPPDKQIVRNGEVSIIPGGYVEFIRGRFSSDNPEIQYCLDKKKGWCSEEQWNTAWLSQNQRLDIKTMQLQALEQRLENQQNELLAQQKAKVSA
jgi:hypothetical protein